MKLPTPRAPAARKGITLVEVLTYIGLASILLATMGTVLHGLSRASRVLDQRRATLQSLNRFAEIFRTDVHEAVALSYQLGQPAPGRPAALTLRAGSPDGPSVIYSFESDRIRRTAEQSEHPTHHEQFRLPDSSHYDVEYDSGLLRLVVHLVREVPHQRPRSIASDSDRKVVIEARVSGR